MVKNFNFQQLLKHNFGVIREKGGGKFNVSGLRENYLKDFRTRVVLKSFK